MFSKAVRACCINMYLRLAGAFVKFQTAPLHRRHTNDVRCNEGLDHACPVRSPAPGGNANEKRDSHTTARPRSYYRSVATAWIKKPTEPIENTTKNAKMDHRRLVTPGCRTDRWGRASHIRTSQRVPTAKRSTKLSASSRVNMRFPKIRRRPVYSVPRWL